MEEYRQITLDEWLTWKEDIRKKLAETADNFVHIGYRLKQIRDSGMYDGAKDVFDFAQKEYGLTKSTVSRFIAINEKYSEGGNSLELKEEFKKFSSSKLAEMLTLPDNEIQMITEKTTVREIRELKNFNDQTMPEPQAAEDEREQLNKCLIDYFKNRQTMLNDVMHCLEHDPPEYKQAAELMVPSGQASHKRGIVFLFFYSWDMGVKYKILTNPEPVSMTWERLLEIIYSIYETCDQSDVWKDFYKTNSVATSQQENENAADSDLPERNDEETESREMEAVPMEEPREEAGEEQKVEKAAKPENVENIPSEPPKEEKKSEITPETAAAEATALTEGAAPAAGKYDKTIKLLMENTAYQANEISKALNEGKKELKEYRKIKARVNNLNCDLEQLIKFMDLATEEGEDDDE